MAFSKDDLRMVLLGKTGSGKSSAGNTILGTEVFKVDLLPYSVTKRSEKHEGIIEGRRVSVIDTPGAFNTSVTEEKLMNEMKSCISLSSPGPHVFLLVIRFGVRFTEEEWINVKWIQENFGEEALKKFTVVLFLGEQKGKPVDVLNHCSELEKYISNISDKHFILSRNNPSQVPKLMELIENTVRRNDGQHYDISMYNKAQRKLEENQRNKKIIICAITSCGLAKGGLNYLNTAYEMQLLISCLVPSIILTDCINYCFGHICDQICYMFPCFDYMHFIA